MGKYRYTGPPKVKSPDELTRKWQRTRVGHLFDVAKAGFGVQAATEDKDTGPATIMLVPALTEHLPRLALADTRGFVWGCRVERASTAIKSSLTPFVHVIGIPSPETPGYGTAEKPIQPYTDKLFQGGELLVQPLQTETQTTAEPIRLGQLVGLNLVLDYSTRPVW